MEKFFIVRNPLTATYDYDDFVKDYPTKEGQLASLCFGYDEGGMDSYKLARVMFGTNVKIWYAEDSVIYADKAAAVRDAEKRLAKMEKDAKKSKTASMATRVAERFVATASGR